MFALIKSKSLLGLRSFYKWATATRLRKALCLTLAALLILTSIRFIFLRPKEVQAADVYLAMDEGYGTSSAVKDSNATVSAGSITNAIWRSEEFCKTGKCLYFDGDGDFVSFADDTNLDFTGTNTFTIQGWFRTTDITSGTRVLVAKHNATAGGYKVYMDSNGYLIFGIDDDLTWGPVDTASTSTTAFDDNKWHFFSAVKNGTTSISLYVDGILYQTDSSLTETGSLVNANTFYLGIDGDGAANDYLGFLDEVKILRTARTQSEVITDYLGGNTSLTGAGPIGWWRMDESSWTNDCSTDTVRDSSGNGLDGDACPTSTGPTGGASGKYGNAGSFDGTNDYVNMGDVIDLSGNQSMAISTWIYPTALPGTNAKIVSKYDAGTAGEWYVNIGSSGQIQFLRECGGFGVSASSPTVSLNSWSHIGAVYDGIKLYIYLNGTPIAQATDSCSISNTSVETVIGAADDAASAENYFTGRIDDVRIYNYARSQTQILEDMAGYPSSGTSASFGPDTSYLSNGLVGYWRMEESSWNGTAGEVKDSSGNSFNGARSGNATTASGKFGNGGSFDGTSDYVSLGNTASVSGATGITISSWIYTNSNPDETIIGRALASAGATRGYRLYTDFSGTIFFTITTTGTGTSSNASWNTGITLSQSSWQHIVTSYDGPSATARIFVNGALQATNTALTTGSMADGADIATIGASNDGNYSVNGKVDDLRLYNRALSPAEVAKLYAFSPGPVGHWKMDENTLNSCSGGTNDNCDSSGNGNDGALSNSGFVTGKYGAGLRSSEDNLQDATIVSDPSSGILDFSNTQSFTQSIWFKLTANEGGGYSQFFSKGYDGSTSSPGYGIDFNSTLGTISCTYVGGTGYDFIEVTKSVYDGNWHHISCVVNREGTDTQYMYVDGVLIGTNTSMTQASAANANNLIIGEFSTSDEMVNGAFDDARIYNYAQTPAQIIEDMNGGHPAPGSPIGSAVAYWNFDEGYSTTAYDSNASTAAEDLTLSAASWTNSGKFGKAWNGTGALWVSRADDNDLDFAATEDFSLSLWFKSDSATNPGATEWLLNKSLSGGTQEAGYAIYANTSGQLCFGIDDDTTWTPDVESCTTTDYYDATWHHITAVRNVTSDTTKIYIDTVEKDSDTDSTTATLANGRILYLGDRQGTDAGDELNGDLDEVKIYRSALTVDQIKVEYLQGSGQLFGSVSTDSSGNPSWSDTESYCPPGQGSTCTAPIAHWKLDENTGTSTFDVSGNGNNSTTWTGTNTWYTGKYGSALNFNNNDGVVRFAETSTTTDLGNADSYTVSVWLKTTDTSASTDSLVAKHGSNTGASPFRIYLGATTRTAGMTVRDASTGIDVTGTVSLNNNAWHHITGVRNVSTDSVQLYVDGVLVDSDTDPTTGSIANDDDISIGNARGSYLTDDFNGQIDDVRIYNYARTPAQVAWDYNRGAPVGHWQMDETSWNGTASEVKDASGNELHGIRAGDATTVTGKINSAGTFDGTNDNVRITESASIDVGATTDSYSLAGWFKTSASYASTAGEFFAKNDGAGTSAFELYFNTSNNVCFGIYDGTNDTNACTSGLTLNDGQWHHVVGIRNASADTVSIYIDGKLANSLTDTTTASCANNDDVSIGNGGTSYTAFDFNGQVDDVRIYRYPLTPQQIKTVMNDNSAVRFAPVTGTP